MVDGRAVGWLPSDATGDGPGAQIATSTATSRVPVDHATIDHRERLWTSGVKSRPSSRTSLDPRIEIAADPFQILYQKNYRWTVLVASLVSAATASSPFAGATANANALALAGRL